MDSKVRKVLKESIKVIKSCSLPNGAIVASNILDKDYPKDVKSYFYIWPRDASFICYASDLLGLRKIPEKFFEWCMEKAEGFKENGVFLANKYYPHGRAAGDYDVEIKPSEICSEKIRKIAKNQVITRLFYTNFQPDQTVTLIWAAYEHSKFKGKKSDEIIEIAADGICNYWKKVCFKIPSYDLWEERVADPSLKQVHTYSLASCIKGLECAVEMIGAKRKWISCLKEMRKVFEKCYLNGYFVKTYGKIVDKTIDSSSLGLAWPFNVIKPNDLRMVNTVKKIVEKNCRNGGVYRYERDKYDGKIEFCKLKLGGAGAWPVLNFWLSIYFCLAGEKGKAFDYFNWVLKRIDRKIPEQIKDDKPASIIPLAWSHAMFIIAGKFLEIF